MNLEKFTERSRGFIQAAQTIAMRESHQRLAPEHILKALMDDEQGLASNLIQRAGGAPERVVQALDLKMAKIPKGSGEPNKKKVGKVTKAQVREIAELKMPDLNAFDVDAAMRIIEGTAHSMGLEVE